MALTREIYPLTALEARSLIQVQQHLLLLSVGRKESAPGPSLASCRGQSSPCPLSLSSITSTVESWQLAFLFVMQVPDLSFAEGTHFKEASTSKMQISTSPATKLDEKPGAPSPRLLCFKDLGWYWSLTLWAACVSVLPCFKFPFLWFLISPIEWDHRTLGPHPWPLWKQNLRPAPVQPLCVVPGVPCTS